MSAPLHIQCFLYLSIWSLTVPWRSKVHMKNVGRAEKTEFVIYNLLAWERKREVLTSLLWHLEMRGKKSSTFGLEVPRGRPRYVKGRLPVPHPKVEAMWWSLSELILIGTIMDFSKLTFNPVKEAKELSKALRTNNYLPQPSRMMRVSSTYCRIGKSLE
jgi:hypothetical protein